MQSPFLSYSQQQQQLQHLQQQQQQQQQQQTVIGVNRSSPIAISPVPYHNYDHSLTSREQYSSYNKNQTSGNIPRGNYNPIPIAHSLNTSSTTTVSSVFSSQNANTQAQYVSGISSDYDLQIKEIEDYYLSDILKNSSIKDTLITSTNSKDIWQYNPNSLVDEQSLPVFVNTPASSTSFAHNNNNSPFVSRDTNNFSAVSPLSPSALPALTSENLSNHNITNIKSPAVPKGSTSSNTNISNRNINKQLFKTELCETFTTKGTCKYGNKCQFAHGLHELNFKNISSNFRTKPCNNWEKLGYCPYGKRCQFKHGDNTDIKIYINAGKIANPPEQRKKKVNPNVKNLERIKW
ncbi:hypothetical protein TBLA_0H01230 [Henningerozyma blattae CBS 6284]|uniref:C3H1-type domain-containing protein n=1 Tax=Henningerozyma blattae (strain ATCC 34711 / CBS 6284 / DSM 70876 / NBRC 10599 / NRRL Y-10934 / UCD 77-7) TaxID=1071380 RepID=I2H7Q8_HENB6|nr:hypothetical protein TBLA_0H01230 [Tetrapisispora blattae CBS 6284]CCH62410.1 hypothetical protein TBLA_0H01230 [Tetrapisispora blattae CBS 6284]